MIKWVIKFITPQFVMPVQSLQQPSQKVPATKHVQLQTFLNPDGWYEHDVLRFRKMRKQMIGWFVFHLVTSIPIFVLGVMHSNGETQCPVKPIISIYAIVAGATGGLKSLLNGIFYCISQVQKKNHKRQEVLSTLTKNVPVLDLFYTVWVFLGCMWVFGVFSQVQFDDSESEFYCVERMYKCVFGTLVVLLIMLPVSWAIALQDYFSLTGEEIALAREAAANYPYITTTTATKPKRTSVKKG